MTHLNPQARELVALAGQEWIAYKVLRMTLESQIRASVVAEMEEVKRRFVLNVSMAMRAAIDKGSTKAALRSVTTKDQRSFEAYLAFDGIGALP